MRQLSRAVALTTILGAALFFPHIGRAQDMRIAVVDVETVTLACDEGKLAAEKFKKRLDEVTATMDKARKDIEDKENRLRTQDRVMSAAAKADLSREIDTAKRDFDRRNEDYQKDLAAFQDQLLGPVSDKARLALEAFIKKNGYAIVIDLSAQNGNVVWANPGNDITLEVIAVLNEDYKRAGATTPASATPAGATPPAAPGTTPATTPR